MTGFFLCLPQAFPATIDYIFLETASQNKHSLLKMLVLGTSLITTINVTATCTCSGCAQIFLQNIFSHLCA